MDKKKNFCVYIDEAGDLGIQRGTRWFVLTAVIIEKDKENSIRKSIIEIKNKLNLQNIHFRNIKDFQKRCFIVDRIANQQFTMVSIIFDTNRNDLLTMKNSLLSYNYLCRFLLERVSWFIRDENGTADIVLSSRGTNRDNELIDYIKDKLIDYKNNNIAPVFGKITAKTASSWDMLQIADVCATSMFYAYEAGGYGFTMPCFAMRLKPRMYTHHNQLIKYGIKFFSDDMQPSQDELNANKICKIK